MNKTCSVCKKCLPLSKFGKSKFGKNGLNSRCKDCASQYSKKNRRTIYKNAKMHLSALKSQCFLAYGGKCQCCKISDFKFLSIDHIMQDGSKERKKLKQQSNSSTSSSIGFTGKSFYRYLKRLGYPQDRYQLLCFNCNFARNYNKGICPHMEKKMRVGVIGHLGTVGSSCAYGFSKLGNEVIGHDINSNSKLEDLLYTHLLFICVPTPSNSDGSCNTTIVEKVIDDLVDIGYKGFIGIKSTVAPGTCAKILEKYEFLEYRLAMVPEFLRERHAIHDFVDEHHILAIGTESDAAFDMFVKVHGDYPKNIIRMSFVEAELIKYFHNVFNAARVVFANGFYEICKKFEDCNYRKIKNAIVKHPAHCDYYLDCNDAFRGFSGPCLPKETKALAKLAKDLKLPCKIFDVIVNDNELYPKTVPSGMRLE